MTKEHYYELALVISGSALLISIIALCFAIANYRRKAGLSLRAKYSFGRDRGSTDAFITDLTLENLKDKAVTIFGIYMKLGNGIYLELENFHDKPMILRAYETFQREYFPLQCYVTNLHRAQIDHLIMNYKVKKSLVLATGDGKYIVPKLMSSWSPFDETIQHFQTTTISRRSAIISGKHIGDRVDYVVEIESLAGQIEVLNLHKGDYRLESLKELAISEHALSTKQNLEDFLEKQRMTGIFNCSRFKVHDGQEIANNAQGFIFHPTIIPMSPSNFNYFIKNRLARKLHNAVRKIKSKKNKIFHKKEKPLKLNH